MNPFKITYIGHATFLLEINGITLLTDPFFSKKSFFSKRIKQPGIAAENLPPLTAIAITNAHYDHLDLLSFKYFSIHTPLILPLGLGNFVRRFLPNPIIELPPWSEHVFMNGLKIHSLPVKHRGFRFSGLTLSKTTAYLFEYQGQTIYFPGVTGFGEHFNQTSNLHSIDVALLPIGYYRPQFLKKNRQLNPHEAIKAYKALKAKTMIPYRWGTFKTWRDDPELPIEWLGRLKREDSHLNIQILEPGMSFETQGDEAYRPLPLISSDS